MATGNHTALAQTRSLKRSGMIWLFTGLILGTASGLNAEESLCCDQKAHTNEVGIELAAGFTWGPSVAIKPYGFSKWEKNTCVYKVGDMARVECVGFGLSAGGDAQFTQGHYFSFDSISGTSNIVGFGGGVLFTFEIGAIFDAVGIEIGGYYSAGLGAGIEMGGSRCETSIAGETTKRFDNLKCRCPTGPDCSRRRRGGGCFPADAEVVTMSGVKHMSDLRVGDMVLSTDSVGNVVYDSVYFFGHADPLQTSQFVQLHLRSQDIDLTLELTEKHFIPACPERGQPCSWDEQVHMYAQNVRPGDYLWAAVDSDRVDRAEVMNVSSAFKTGLYNPYTLSGNLIVNSAYVSSHSNWVLDAWTPRCLQCYLPYVYQVLFFPGMMMFHATGSGAGWFADIIDVNNPQRKPEDYGHGPKFLLTSAFLSLAVLAMVLRPLAQMAK